MNPADSNDMTSGSLPTGWRPAADARESEPLGLMLGLVFEHAAEPTASLLAICERAWEEASKFHYNPTVWMAPSNPPAASFAVPTVYLHVDGADVHLEVFGVLTSGVEAELHDRGWHDTSTTQGTSAWQRTFVLIEPIDWKVMVLDAVSAMEVIRPFEANEEWSAVIAATPSAVLDIDAAPPAFITEIVRRSAFPDFY